MQYIEGPTNGKPWRVIAPDGSTVGDYHSEQRAENERYARTIRAQGIARRAREQGARHD